MTTFTLKENEEYIQLNDLLKVLSWVNSGGHAKQCILEELVQVNDNIEMRVRRKVKKGDKVSFNEQEVVVD
jgi:ribosome-associated protein